MYRPYIQSQLYLLPPSLQEVLGDDHPVYLINELVDQLDLRVLEKRYGPMGQPAYHPGMMLKVTLYGASVGVYSSRKLGRACRENVAFQYVSGMEKPSYKTFIEFRQRHREDMKEVFVQTVKLARKLGLARMLNVAQDGTKIGADTSKHKAMSHGRMEAEETRLKQEIEEWLKRAEAEDRTENAEYGVEEDGYSLKEELARREERLKKIQEAKAALEAREAKDHPGEPIDPKKQISFADKDARCFHKKSEGAQYVYNAQAAVDMESQIIVENHIEDSVSDAAAAPTALQKMEETLEVKPEKLVMDGGYANKETMKSCQAHEVTPVCSPAREGKESGDGKGDGLETFTHNAEKNEFRCPHGTVYKFDHWNADQTKAIYRNQEASPCGCEHERTKQGAVLRVRESHLAQREFRRILSQPENQVLYRRRKCTVEPVFGQIKSGMGFRRFLRRGRGKVASEWNMVCASFNLKKIAAQILAGTCPEGWPAARRAGEAVAMCFRRTTAICAHYFRILVCWINVDAAPFAHPV